MNASHYSLKPGMQTRVLREVVRRELSIAQHTEPAPAQEQATVSQEASEAPLVCVTGANGFFASCLVKLLLERGYRVAGTVRSLDPAKARHPALQTHD